MMGLATGSQGALERAASDLSCRWAVEGERLGHPKIRQPLLVTTTYTASRLDLLVELGRGKETQREDEGGLWSIIYSQGVLFSLYVF